jgi:hypothetical protein
MSGNLYAAHNQWMNRPPDERFSDLDTLLAFTEGLGTASEERVRDLADVHVDTSEQFGIAVNGHGEPGLLTNWAFNQLCTSVGAPAKYLRSSPPHTMVECSRCGLASPSASILLF